MKRSELAAFIKKEHQKLVRYARVRLNETAEMDAEDIVQDVLANILDKADITVPLENLAAYLYRSIKNRMIDLFRSKKALVSLNQHDENQVEFIELLQSKHPNALQALQTQEGKAQLFRALQELKEMERKVVIAHELEGISFKEMAGMWGVAQNTLLSYKARAMKKLKDYFAE